MTVASEEYPLAKEEGQTQAEHSKEYPLWHWRHPQVTKRDSHVCDQKPTSARDYDVSGVPGVGGADTTGQNLEGRWMAAEECDLRDCPDR